jgi:16S rRNA (cytidine1402-2'-O)-methyltransferase
MGRLFVVGTPIGHLKDVTMRAIEVLQEVDLILCEDTRVTGKLTRRYGIRKPLESFFTGNEARKLDSILSRLEEGKTMALVSDAGTPGISDPGFLLVRACRERGIPVTPIPGPSALATALSASGLPSQRVLFLGFPPRKANERKILLESLATDPSTLVFYEAPHRVRLFLQEASAFLSGRECVVGREMTKRFESIGPVTDPDEIPEKGEFVVLYGPPPQAASSLPSPADAEIRYRELLAEGLEDKEALRWLAKERGVSRREIYAIIKGKDREPRRP